MGETMERPYNRACSEDRPRHLSNRTLLFGSLFALSVAPNALFAEDWGPSDQPIVLKTQGSFMPAAAW
jgi:hypothetical protein